MKTVISLKNIVHQLSNTNNLSIKNLEISEKENLFIMAKEESGLSTFLKILSGIIPPEQGEVLIKGENLSFCHENTYKLIKNQITYTYQHGVMLSNLTIFENLMLTLNFHKNNLKSNERKKTIIKKATFYEVQEFLQKRPVELSFMQKKFFGILRSFIINPELVILDEPFQNFNLNYIQKVESILEQHLAEGNNIIYGSTKDNELNFITKRLNLNNFII